MNLGRVKGDLTEIIEKKIAAKGSIEVVFLHMGRGGGGGVGEAIGSGPEAGAWEWVKEPTRFIFTVLSPDYIDKGNDCFWPPQITWPMMLARSLGASPRLG